MATLPTHFFLEPLDAATNGSIAGKLPEDRACFGTVTIDGQKHDLWSVTYKEMLFFVETRRKDPAFIFTVWYRNKDTEKQEIELWRPGGDPVVQETKMVFRKIKKHVKSGHLVIPRGTPLGKRIAAR